MATIEVPTTAAYIEPHNRQKAAELIVCRAGAELKGENLARSFKPSCALHLR